MISSNLIPLLVTLFFVPGIPIGLLITYALCPKDPPVLGVLVVAILVSGVATSIITDIDTIDFTRDKTSTEQLCKEFCDGKYFFYEKTNWRGYKEPVCQCKEASP